MQFRLSTFLLAMVVFATSLALAGPWGIVLAVYMLVLVGLTRASLSGSAGGLGACLVWLIGIGLPLLPVLLTPSSVSRVARRGMCATNLRVIALGLQGYHDQFGCLPPASVPDKNGKPMNSWRVAVLPYLEHADLYRSYNFNEPWNGPRNSKLATWLKIYVCPGDHTITGRPPNATNYVAVTGTGTVWSSNISRPGKPIANDRRVLLVEVENSGIPWMEPKDLTVDEAIAGLTSKSGLRICSGHDKRLANAVLADGEVVELPIDLSPELLRIALTEDISHFYKHISTEQIEAMRWTLPDDYPYLWPRLVVWIASVMILLVHVTTYDFDKKMEETVAVTGKATEP
jgi:hypothetical protein